jgi:prepilin-type N-terminal cleavage/methylation domain-containing protein
MKMKNKKGFTLFELLVSISIIAILTALATVSFSNAQKKARDSKRIQDVDAVRKALEMYYSDKSYSYPTALLDLTNGDPVYLQQVPADPKGESWAGYNYVSDGSSFTFCADLEGDKGNSSSDECAFVTGGAGGFYCAKNQQ